MMTNLLASVIVTLVTNTTDIYPQHRVPIILNGSTNGATEAVADKDPKEKWVRTEVVETGKIWFKWNGEITEGVINRPVTNWTTHFNLEPPKWIQSTNNVPVPLVWPNSGIDDLFKGLENVQCTSAILQ